MSVFEDDSPDRCYLCGAYGRTDRHHVFGGACRQISERYDLTVHLCRECHSLIHGSAEGAELMDYLHQKGQIAYEERFGNRRAFIREFIKSYL